MTPRIDIPEIAIVVASLLVFDAPAAEPVEVPDFPVAFDVAAPVPDAPPLVAEDDAPDTVTEANAE